MAGLRELGKQRRRERILESARVLVAEGGLEAMTVGRIAARAEVSPATIYNLCGTHDDLLVSLMTEDIEAHDQYLATTESADPLMGVFASVEAMVSGLCRDAKFFRPALLASRELQGDARVTLSQRAVRALREGVVEAHAQGLLRSDLRPDVLGERCFWSFYQLIMSWATGVLDDEHFRAFAHYNVGVFLLAAATEASRTQILERVQALEPVVAN